MASTVQKRKIYNDELELLFSPKARNRYTVNDLKNKATLYPIGVTTVLSKTLAKEALMLWPMYEYDKYVRALVGTKILIDNLILDKALKAYTVKSDKGKDVGTEVHEAIEQILNKCKEAEGSPIDAGIATAEDVMKLTPQAQFAIKAFLEWLVRTTPYVIATEQICYSKEHNYAGTFDALLEIDGKVILADIKTSNASRTAPLGIYPENFLQLGAYSLAQREETGKEVDDLMVINANKEGRLSTLRASELGLSVADCEASWLDLYKTFKFMQPLINNIREGITV